MCWREVGEPSVRSDRARVQSSARAVESQLSMQRSRVAAASNAVAARVTLLIEHTFLLSLLNIAIGDSYYNIALMVGRERLERVKGEDSLRSACLDPPGNSFLHRK